MDNMNQMNNMPMGNSEQNKRTMYIVLAVVVVVVLAFWWWRASRQAVETSQPAGEVPAELESINQELEGLDIGDINEEFEQIDQELQGL